MRQNTRLRAACPRTLNIPILFRWDIVSPAWLRCENLGFIEGHSQLLMPMGHIHSYLHQNVPDSSLVDCSTALRGPAKKMWRKQ
jgi:hypothetical protein